MEFDIEKKTYAKDNAALTNRLEVEYAISNWTKLHYII